MRDQLIRQFLIELRTELEIEGIGPERRAAVVGEAQSHLVEAFDAANPSNEAEAQEVLRGFGSARTLARSLAGEYSRAGSRRRYVWPALFVLAAVGILSLFVVQSHLTLFGRSIWTGTVYLLVCGGLLLGLGYRARRPLFGQFAALAAGLLVAKTGWLMLTSYAVPDHYNDFVKRSEVASDVAKTNGRIGQERETARQLKLGQQFFSDPSQRPAPAFLRSVDGYILPDAIREAGYGRPGRTGQGFTALTWKKAVLEWNVRRYVGESGGVPGPKTSAEVWMIRAEQNIEAAENHIRVLSKSMKEPWWIQLEWTVQLEAPGVIVLSAGALLFTNAGWLLWVLVVPLGRQVRRVRLAAG